MNPSLYVDGPRVLADALQRIAREERHARAYLDRINEAREAETIDAYALAAMGFSL